MVLHPGECFCCLICCFCCCCCCCSFCCNPNMHFNNQIEAEEGRDGIYRLSGQASHIQALKQQFDGGEVSLLFCCYHCDTFCLYYCYFYFCVIVVVKARKLASLHLQWLLLVFFFKRKCQVPASLHSRDLHAVASLLKLYFRELPASLLPGETIR